MTDDERHSVWQWRPGSPHGVAEARPEARARGKASASMRKDIRLIAFLLVLMVATYAVALWASTGVGGLYEPITWGAGVVSAMAFGALLLKVAEKLVDPSLRLGHILLVSAVALGLLTVAYMRWTGGL